MQSPFAFFHLMRDKFNFESLSQQFREHRIIWINLVALLTFAVVILIGSFHHDNDRVLNAESDQAQRTKMVMQQLNDINDEIHTLESSPQSGAALKDSLSTITKNLTEVQQSLSGIKDDMDSQMSDLRKSVQNTGGKQYIDAKAAAVIAQRAVNLLSLNDPGHIYQKLSDNCGDGCSADDFHESDDHTQFQMIYPEEQNACEVLGAQPLNYGNGMDTESHGAYAWIVWRHYRGCIQGDGQYLGRIG